MNTQLKKHIKLSSSLLILSLSIFQANKAFADVVISCTNDGTNCPSPAPNYVGDINSTITVPAGSCTAGSITDVNVNLDITHSWVGDLEATLVSPDGSTSTLLDRPGTTGVGFGCSANNVNAIFDDASGTPAEGECNAISPAIGGTVSPSTPLSIYNSGNADGAWTLTIVDNFGGQSAVLNNWSLDIKCSDPAVPTAVPIFSFWGLAGLMSLLGFGGSFMSRRKKLK